MLFEQLGPERKSCVTRLLLLKFFFFGWGGGGGGSGDGGGRGVMKVMHTPQEASVLQ